jgi:hypothetical protein
MLNGALLKSAHPSAMFSKTDMFSPTARYVASAEYKRLGNPQS